MPTISPEPLTIENLARAIHEDELAACVSVGVLKNLCGGKGQIYNPWPTLAPRWKKVRHEQARLMLNRWMR